MAIGRMSPGMRIALAQINPTIGDITGNTVKIVQFIEEAAGQGARLVVFPEMSIIGYPPKDLLLKPSVIERCEAAVMRVAQACQGVAAVVGLPYRSRGARGLGLHNAAAVCSGAKVVHWHFKHLLPMYDVFDESRYFEPGPAVDLSQIDDLKVGISVCEDLWNDEEIFSRQLYHDNPIHKLAGLGAQLFINCSASPFIVRKQAFRLKLLQHTARRYGLPIIYVNQVGGNDELIFDGNSCAIGADGELLAHARDFEEDLLVLDLKAEAAIRSDALVLTGDELCATSDLKTLRHCAKSYAKDRLQGQSIVNRYTGARIFMAETAVKKMVSGPTTITKLQVIPAIPRLLELGKHLGSSPDARGRNTIRAIHHYGWPLTLAGTRYDVDLVVRETTNGEFFYDHDLTEMKESAGLSGEAAMPRSLRPADHGREGMPCGQVKSTSTARIETPRQGVASVYEALVLGTRDYCHKCGFNGIVLGLSGGVDSAVTACIAVAAVGGENVTGVAMPSRYSSEGSVRDAQALANNLGIAFKTIPIAGAHEAMERTLLPHLAGLPPNSTEENIQARLRGIILMGLSNKFGWLLVTTGNKSELAVGYCTLYGDMAGGLALLSDVPKMLVYELAHWINAPASPLSRSCGGPPIPGNSITKVPSAELRPNQTDQDTLPPYEVLDQIIERYVEREQSARQIIAETNIDPATVTRIVTMIDRNEYKRKQAPPGLKVTGRAFGFGRRMPIAQRYDPAGP
jgi:NAD+ synthetase